MVLANNACHILVSLFCAISSAHQCDTECGVGQLREGREGETEKEGKFIRHIKWQPHSFITITTTIITTITITITALQINFCLLTSFLLGPVFEAMPPLKNPGNCGEGEGENLSCMLLNNWTASTPSTWGSGQSQFGQEEQEIGTRMPSSTADRENPMTTTYTRTWNWWRRRRRRRRYSHDITCHIQATHWSGILFFLKVFLTTKHLRTGKMRREMRRGTMISAEEHM